MAVSSRNTNGAIQCLSTAAALPASSKELFSKGNNYDNYAYYDEASSWCDSRSSGDTGELLLCAVSPITLPAFSLSAKTPWLFPVSASRHLPASTTATVTTSSTHHRHKKSVPTSTYQNYHDHHLVLPSEHSYSCYRDLSTGASPSTSLLHPYPFPHGTLRRRFELEESVDIKSPFFVLSDHDNVSSHLLMTLTHPPSQITTLPIITEHTPFGLNPPPYTSAQPLLAAAFSRGRSKASLFKLFDIVRDLDGGEVSTVLSEEEDNLNPPPSYTETMAWFTKAKAWGENIAKVLNEDEVRTL